MRTLYTYIVNSLKKASIYCVLWGESTLIVGGPRSGKKEVTVVAAAAAVVAVGTIAYYYYLRSISPTYSVTFSDFRSTLAFSSLSVNIHDIHSFLFLSTFSFYPSLSTFFFFRVSSSSSL